MQSSTSSLKKWLPAIFLAVALHIIIIIAFLNSQNEKVGADSSDLSNQKTKQQQTQISNEVLNNNINKNPTLISNENGLITQRNDNEVMTDHASHDSSKNIDNTDVNSNTRANISDENPIRANITPSNMRSDLSKAPTSSTDGNKVSNHQGSILSNRNPSVAQSNELSNKSGSNRNSKTESNNSQYSEQTELSNQRNNPNEQLLLSSDLPAAQSQNIEAIKNYDQAAKEVEKINAQLSATINSIKEEKMREIKAQQERNKKSYLQEKQKKGNEKLSKQVAAVSEQLAIDEAAEAEFSSITNKKSTP